MREYASLRVPPDAVRISDDRLEQLPPSARRVFEAILEEGPLTQKGAAACTGLPSRTLRFALKRLREMGLVDSRCSLRDSRCSYYFVARDLVDEVALARRGPDAETL